MIRSAIAYSALMAGLLTSPAAAPASAVSIAQSGAQVSAADAAPFIGDWTLTLQGPNGPGTFDLSVKVEKEKVVGEIANQRWLADDHRHLEGRQDARAAILLQLRG